MPTHRCCRPAGLLPLTADPPRPHAGGNHPGSAAVSTQSSCRCRCSTGWCCYALHPPLHPTNPRDLLIGSSAHNLCEGIATRAPTWAATLCSIATSTGAQTGPQGASLIACKWGRGTHCSSQVFPPRQQISADCLTACLSAPLGHARFVDCRPDEIGC